MLLPSKASQKEGKERPLSQIEQANGTSLEKCSQMNPLLRVLFGQEKKNPSQIDPDLKQKPICEKTHP